MPVIQDDSSSWILSNVFPVLGVVLANIMSFSPLPTFYRVLVSPTRQLHPIDPMPIAIMFGCAIHTFAYSLAIENPYMYASNGPAVLGVGMSLLILLRAKDLDSRREKWIMGITLSSIAILIVNIGFKDVLKADWAVQVMGITFNVYQYLFFSFPLSQLASILRKSDASPLVPTLVVAVTVNGTLWTGYGLVLGNYYIAGPNLVASVVGVAQIVCIVVLGRKEAKEQEQRQRSGGGSTAQYQAVSSHDEEAGEHDRLA